MLVEAVYGKILQKCYDRAERHSDTLEKKYSKPNYASLEATDKSVNIFRSIESDGRKSDGANSI